MNRLVSVNLEGVRPDRLPPARAEGPVRALFLTGSFLGFGTYHRQLLAYAEASVDLDAVHVELKAGTWARVLGKSIRRLGRGVDQHAWRHLLMWRWVINRWLRGPLSLDRFDVVHVLTEGNALSIPDFACRVPTAFAVSIDATAEQFITDFGYRRRAMAPMLAAQRRIFDAADLVVGRNAWRRKGGPEVLALHQQRWAEQADLHVFSQQAPADASARNVSWHGRVDRDELLDRWLPEMDLFVMPTREDMHPWAILDALGAGLPVVSSRLAGIPEMVVHGRTGLLAPAGATAEMGEAVASLLADRRRCHEMGIAARRHVETAYDPDIMFGGLMQRLVDLGRVARERAS